MNGSGSIFCQPKLGGSSGFIVLSISCFEAARFFLIFFKVDAPILAYFCAGGEY